MTLFRWMNALDLENLDRDRHLCKGGESYCIAYWSRTLKSAERNYSPTEREALSLRDGLVKCQPYLEGEKILAVTNHAAPVWNRTGAVFVAYPDLQIVHRAGRVHSNVDPISGLQQ